MGSLARFTKPLTVLHDHDSGPSSHRDPITSAASGDTIVFDRSLAGQTITLTSRELDIARNLDIEGLGANRLTISGNQASRAVNVSGGATVTIAGLTIADGYVHSDLGGGGILNQDSTVTLAHDDLTGNEALGLGGASAYARGGAINNLAGTTLTVTDSQFVDNQVAGGSGGEGVGWGAIGTFAEASVTGSTFTGNRAQAGDGGVAPANAFFTGCVLGGAICTNGGGLFGFSDSFTASNVLVMNDQAIGGAGNAAGGIPAGVLVGTAIGGGFALFDGGTTTVTISNSTIDRKMAIGGESEAGGNGADGRGGGLATDLGGNLVVTDCTLAQNNAEGGQ